MSFKPLRGKLVFQNSSFLLLAQAPIQAINALYVVVLAQSLGTEWFGQFAAVWALLAMSSAVIEQGPVRCLTQKLVQAPEETGPIVSSGAALSVVLWGLAFAAILGLTRVMGYPSAVVDLAALASLSLIPRFLWNTLVTPFYAQQRMGRVAVLLIVSSGLNAASGICLLWLGAGLTGVFIGTGLAHAMTLLLTWAWVRAASPVSWRAASLRQVTALARAATPFVLRAVAGVIYFRLDLLLLTVLAGFRVAGEYQAAYKLFELAIMIPGAVNVAVYPMMAALHLHDRDRLRRLFGRQLFYMAAVGFPFAFFLALLAEPTLGLLFGAAYLSAAPTLSLLALVVLLMYLNAAPIALLVSGARQTAMTVAATLTLLCNLIFNLLLIPRLGAEGAALALIVSESFQFLFLIYLVRPYLAGTRRGLGLGRLVAAALLLAITGWALRDAPVLAVGAGFAAYGLMVLRLNVLPREEREYMGALVQRVQKAVTST